MSEKIQHSIYYTESKEFVIHDGFSKSFQIRGKMVSGAFRMVVDGCLLDDLKWCAPFAEALAPKPGERILDCGPGSSSRALCFADRFPDAQFVAVDYSQRRVAKSSKQASLICLQNYKAMTFEDVRMMPLAAGSFDKVAIVLNLHSLSPEDKTKNLREFRRITRRGGTILVADIDKPKTSREDVILKITQLLYGSEAIRPHTSGAWPKFLLEADFSGVRRLSEHSLWIGRMALVRGRKQ
ncbi:class I SAM-dependent methyltransferase [Methylobacterium sp. DB0501]|uniref:class I SAM-dependent methyltransferase n=1 Tax=Methylobacterium sp. DB0501 TaxID=2709665 RepID=UPI0013EB940C|nr:class I SAM-dependent methyltransferase [Methylobacterium sp. DB0501]NGM38579.1 class I SAM-dependent methyltransferase [Methylobacterium sp. DB0501]